ncbi:hypothetical protein C8J56DRAFT_890585 [Mycena floridula]|nr:hypothetical protein C8J56DRAFT_890585 [Mycena floridula]
MSRPNSTAFQAPIRDAPVLSQIPYYIREGFYAFKIGKTRFVGAKLGPLIPPLLNSTQEKGILQTSFLLGKKLLYFLDSISEGPTEWDPCFPWLGFCPRQPVELSHATMLWYPMAATWEKESKETGHVKAEFIDDLLRLLQNYRHQMVGWKWRSTEYGSMQPTIPREEDIRAYGCAESRRHGYRCARTIPLWATVDVLKNAFESKAGPFPKNELLFLGHLTLEEKQYRISGAVSQEAVMRSLAPSSSESLGSSWGNAEPAAWPSVPQISLNELNREITEKEAKAATKAAANPMPPAYPKDKPDRQPLDRYEIAAG